MLPVNIACAVAAKNVHHQINSTNHAALCQISNKILHNLIFYFMAICKQSCKHICTPDYLLYLSRQSLSRLFN